VIGVFDALVPVFILIALGAAMKRAGFPGDEAWTGLERLTYFFLFPAFLFHTLATAEFAGFDIWPLAAALLSGIGVMALVLAAVRRPMALAGPQYSSVYQGAIRWNGFVAVAAIQSLHGDAGVTLMAVSFAAIVPTVNTLCVMVLARHANAAPAKAAVVLRTLARNPLILACVAGIVFQAAGWHLPAAGARVLEVLADASLPLALMIVGAGLNFSGLGGSRRAVATTSALKLILMPLLMAGFCALYGVEGAARAAAIIAGAVPGAPSSFILARILGGDAPLMASLITVGTVLAFVTMPVMVYLLA